MADRFFRVAEFGLSGRESCEKGVFWCEILGRLAMRPFRFNKILGSFGKKQFFRGGELPGEAERGQEKDSRLGRVAHSMLLDLSTASLDLSAVRRAYGAHRTAQHRPASIAIDTSSHHSFATRVPRGPVVKLSGSGKSSREDRLPTLAANRVSYSPAGSLLTTIQNP